MRISRKRIVLFSSNSTVNLIYLRDDSYSVETELLCFTVEQGEGIVNVSKPNGRASVVVKNPFLFKMAHKDIGQNRT